MSSEESKKKNSPKSQKKTAKRKSKKTPSKLSALLPRDTIKEQLKEKPLDLLSSMVEQCHEGMALVDLDGNIQFINQAFAGVHGYKPDELIGKNLAIFHNDEQMASVMAANKSIQQTGEFFGEIWHMHRDGSVFPTIMNNSLLRDESGRPIGMIGSLRDITMQKQAEDALRESEARYRQLMNSAGNPIMLFDLNNQILFVNNTCANNFDLKPDDIIGKSIYDLMPDFADEISRRNKTIIDSGQGLEVEDFVQMASSKRWFITNLQPARDADGNIYGVLVISNDITKLKTSEESLKNISEKLKTQHDALHEKNITLKQVLSHFDEKRRDYLLDVQKEIKKAITPVIRKFKKKLGNSYSKDIETLEASLKAVLTLDQDSFKSKYDTLTTRETQISELIRKGLSSKEISSKLNISIPTVFKHREQVRKKLEITNKNISLATYLRTHA